MHRVTTESQQIIFYHTYIRGKDNNSLYRVSCYINYMSLYNTSHDLTPILYHKIKAEKAKCFKIAFDIILLLLIHLFK